MAFTRPVARRSVRQSAIARNVAEYDQAAMVDRILDTIGAADEQSVKAGLGWYSIANEICHDIAQSSKVPVNRVAAVMAVLSPRCGWADNISGTRALCHGEDPPAAILPASIAKALRILAGEVIDRVLGGRKVRSFFRNIIAPTRPGPVTVDSHAIMIATGERDDRVFDGIGRYVIVASAYRTAGRALGLLPHDAQAIAWVAHRAATGADRYDGLTNEEATAVQLEELF